jgi:hypothetical protein
MDFYLIGFFPKRRVTRANWNSLQGYNPKNSFPEPQPIQQICSVSNCRVKRLSIFDYQELSLKSFNQYGGFNQLAKEFSIDKPEPGPYTIVEIWKYLGS